MPFTFAHPAAVVHLGRRFPRLFNMSALVTGSMAPDYEYFFRANGYSGTHNDILFHMTGGLAIAVALALFFHIIIKRPLIRHLPSPFSGKLAPITEKKWRPDRLWWLTFAPSFVIGMLSHLFIDGFTHASGFAVRGIPLLSATVTGTPVPLRVYSLLQHGGGLLGLLILASLLRGPSPENPDPVPSRRKGLFWTTAALTGSAALLLLLLNGNEYGFSRQALLNLIVAGLTSALIGISVSCLLFRGGTGRVPGETLTGC